MSAIGKTHSNRPKNDGAPAENGTGRDGRIKSKSNDLADAPLRSTRKHLACGGVLRSDFVALRHQPAH